MRPKNPFTPSFGKVPPHLAGRDELLQDMEVAFENGPGDPNLSTLLIGARGTGKTALLSCIAESALPLGWISANVSAVPGMLDDIVQRTCEAGAEFLDTSEGARLKALGIGQFLSLEVEHGAPAETNWRTRMNALFRQLATFDVGLLITVDEVDPNLDEMVLLASNYQHFVREDKKVALVMAGLPYNVESLISNKSVSFLRRCRQQRLGRISDADIENALVATIEGSGKTISNDALDMAVGAIDGFPYMMQLVGYRMWARSTGAVIDVEDAERAIARATIDLRDGVLSTTYRELSAGDLRFLQAMLPDDGESSLAVIAERMGVRSNYASEYKSRLLAQGIIGNRGGGYLGFDMPGFKEYLVERSSQKA